MNYKYEILLFVISSEGIRNFKNPVNILKGKEVKIIPAGKKRFIVEI